MKGGLIISILAILLSINLVLAQELPSPGLLLDSPFYSVKTFLEKVRLWLTLDPEARAIFHAFLAEQRLSELNATIAKGEFQYVQGLREDYENEVNETEVEMNRTLGLGRNVTALAEHICNMTYKHVSILQKNLEKAPEAARQGLENAINASIKGYENCLERLEDALNETGEIAKKFKCTNDVQCVNLTVKCPATLGYQISCFIPENKTLGFCKCQTTWNKTALNCTDDSECKELICPMVLENDTSVCLNGRCACGAKWQLINRTEWRERFKEEYTNITSEIQKMIKERVEIERGKRKG